jgi:hypothetical protein
MCDTTQRSHSTRSNTTLNQPPQSFNTANTPIPPTLNCSILSLNCAKGKATTLEALNYASTHPNYNIVLLQEPYLNSHKLPPPLNNFQLFYPPPPPGQKITCATYVCTSADLQPSVAFTHGASFLGVTIKTSQHPLTLYNFYSPGGHSTAVAHLLPSFVPRPHSLICGDFNAHHSLWYGDRAPEYSNTISRTDNNHNAEIIVDHAITHSLTLHNTPGEFTFYHRVATLRPTIIDLTFSRGQVTNLITDWKLGESFNSDHLSQHITLSLIAPPDVPYRAWSKTDWTIFEDALKDAGLDFSSLSSPGEVERAATAYQHTLNTAIDKSTPLLTVKSAKRVRPWWNKALERQGLHCKQLQRLAQQHRDDEDL